MHSLREKEYGSGFVCAVVLVLCLTENWGLEEQIELVVAEGVQDLINRGSGGPHEALLIHKRSRAFRESR